MGLGERADLAAPVDYQQRLREAVHAADAVEVAHELLFSRSMAERPFLVARLGQALLGLLDLLQALEAAADRGVVLGERAAQPALGHAVHARALGLGLHQGPELRLRADDEDVAAAAGQALEEVGGAQQAADRLLEVDDVD